MAMTLRQLYYKLRQRASGNKNGRLLKSPVGCLLRVSLAERCVTGGSESVTDPSAVPVLLERGVVLGDLGLKMAVES